MSKKEFPKIEESLDGLWNLQYKAQIASILLAKGIDPVIYLSCNDDKYAIEHDSKEFGHLSIARFSCQPMSGCHAIILFHSVAVHDFLRGCRLGSILHEMWLEAAKMSGFAYAQCTTIKSNIAQNKILKHYGWEPVKEFMNIKTGNIVVYWMKEIPQIKEEEE